MEATNGFIELILDIPPDVPLSDLPFTFDLYFAMKDTEVVKVKQNLLNRLNTVLQIHNLKVSKENSYRSLIGIRTKYSLAKYIQHKKVPNMGLSKVWIPQIAAVVDLALENSGFCLKSHSNRGSVSYYTFGRNGRGVVNAPVNFDLPPLAVPAD